MRNLVALLLFASFHAVNSQSPTSLPLTKTIPLAGVAGRFDHFAIDLAGHRLFAAATGNHSVEVIDLKSDKVEQSITGLGKPHGLAWAGSTGSLYVSDGTLGELRVYKGSPLKLAGSIKLSDDADDMTFDEARHMLYVGHGGASPATPALIAVVDTATLTLIANIPASSHPEGLDLDERGNRVFANIADSAEIAVIDGAGNSIASHWKLTNAADNVPMAYDAARATLYVACRAPAQLLALNAASGAEVSRASIGEGSDDLFYDAAQNRLFVISGAGEVDTIQVDAAGKLLPLGVLKTAAGAKTALFVPSQNLLYVGIPGVANHAAEIRVYSTSKTGESR